MNKRIEKIVEKVKIKGNNIATPRRDQVRKAIEENAFDYMIYQGYDEVYDVKPVEMAATLENIADYWLRNGDMWASINNNCLDVTIKYGYSYIDLFVDLKEDEEQSLNTIESEEVKVTYNEEKNGIEVKFNTKPDQEILNELKKNGFRWHRVKKVWYAKQTEERVNFVNSLVAEDKDNLSTENKIKPFTSEEMEETNKIIDMIIEMDWELLNVEINKEDNCIYGNVKKSNGVIEKEGLYAPSDDLHELDGVYRCLKGKIVSNVLLNDMEEVEAISTLCEENNVISLEDHREKIEEVKEEKIEMEMNFDDILESFDNVEIENKNRLCDEDLNFLEDLQEKFNNMREKFKLYIDFYGNNKICDLEEKELKRSIYDLKSDFIKEIVFPKCIGFINKVYNYFKKKYNVTLDFMSHDTDYYLDGREKRAEENLNWFMNELDYNLILDDIFEQLGGVSFEDKRINEAKEEVIKKCTGWNKSLLNVKGKNLTIDNYIYYSSWSGYKIDYSNKDNLIPLLTLVEEFNNTYLMTNELINVFKIYEDVTGKIFDIKGEKIKGIKFFKNGKIQLVFNSGIEALQFAKEYLNYKEVA